MHVPTDGVRQAGYRNRPHPSVRGPGAARLLRRSRLLRPRLRIHEVNVDQGPMFFAGRMRLRWGHLGRGPHGMSGVVYFSGRTPVTLLGMGGSDRHLVGAPEGGQSLGVGSAAPELIEAMRHHWFEEDGLRLGPDTDPDSLLAAMIRAEVTRGPASKLTFLAIALDAAGIPADPTFQQFPKGEQRALLGHPSSSPWNSDLAASPSAEPDGAPRATCALDGSPRTAPLGNGLSIWVRGACIRWGLPPRPVDCGNRGDASWT